MKLKPYVKISLPWLLGVWKNIANYTAVEFLSIAWTECTYLMILTAIERYLYGCYVWLIGEITASNLEKW